MDKTEKPEITEKTKLPPPGAPDIEIARAAFLRPIFDIAKEKMRVPSDALLSFGNHKAKLSHKYLSTLRKEKTGKLILVTAVTPTPAGEGKTTTSIGLNDGLNYLGYRSAVCLREPSLGPCFGMKGGAAGGGRAQVLPMEDINLHFNGDFHAITSAHNLLSALIDNHLQWDNQLNIDSRRITWKRVLDMNDRALRKILVGLGGAAHGTPREDGFDITVASEIMAIFCLSKDLKDLQNRLGNIILGLSRTKQPITVRDLKADGAMTVLLRDALQPNLVQSIEHSPAFIHGGPFANIAHGCNSLISTKAALSLNDVVVTEAGFGADLGAEKFLNIKCRQSGLRPDSVVLVCTVRALKMQGGKKKDEINSADPQAVYRGLRNLEKHIKNLFQFGLKPIVAINHFIKDTEREIETIQNKCAELGVEAIVTKHWAVGAKGAADLARAVMNQIHSEEPKIELSYPDGLSLIDKVEAVATKIYGASEISITDIAKRAFADFEELGFGHLPVCIAKTQYSFSSDPMKLGAPENHILTVREAKLSAGAGFVVVICGDIMTMPGLPRRPAALDINLDEHGNIVGLF